VIKGFADRDPKVQLAACDSMFNIIKICKEAILQSKDFLKVFDEVIDLITDVNSEVREWAKKVDDLLKDVVYASLIKYL
jgi:hypothetical protein